MTRDPTSTHSLATNTRIGAYGLHLPDLAGASEYLIAAPESWPRWQIVLATGAGAPNEFVEPTCARICSEPSGWVDIDLVTQTSTLRLPEEPAPANIVHPFLGSTAVIAAHWRGSQSFHAGAFLTDRGAWAVLGYKGAGKSSLLAALSNMGVPILTDDVLVINGEREGLAGPRCIDLRHETASALGVGIGLGFVGTRERWRVPLDPIAAELPLIGWVCLDWGDAEVLAVTANERIAILYQSLCLRVPQRDPGVLAQLMDLFALPMVRFRRPKLISSLGETAASLLAHIEQL